ncbi:TetR/AcrR family transcriptional regulator [Dactylosporangium sp. CA-092794]|uniref:TetR/AcrR family transcriptional regulator n=1 Tax=Dactylosporangium sp. CA-092794 TaxID=3239929 RepID=UPI003D93D570
MPRAGLNTAEVVAAGAELADEAGIGSVSLAALAERLGVKAPALYKHVDGIGDLRHRIATLAMTELGDAVRDALQGKSGADAIGALFTTLQSYIAEHPGRYRATTGAQFQGDDDPLLVAGTRVIKSIRAALSGYGIRPDELDHAIRMLRCIIHGYALLQAANGFQWGNDPDESVAWMIRFVNAGLTAVGTMPPDRWIVR